MKEAARAPSFAPGRPQADPVNVLLVDDQPARLLTYRAILEPLGERLIEAQSGADALAKLMREEVAVILLDVNMPGMDGFETATMIHQHPRFEKTPIIFVTAVNVSDMDRLRGYELGAVDYVMVPIIPEVLRSKVMVLAELHRKRRELEKANADLRAEKVRELAVLNESLQRANEELGERNKALATEVGERRRAEAKLLEQDRRKDHFIATLAHEIRNPLASVSNSVHVWSLAARHRDVDDSGHKLLEAMRRQIELLVRLTDDLLDVARISQDKLKLRREIVDLRSVIESAVEMVAPLIEGGRHVLTVEIPDQEMLVRIDSQRMVQAFSNMLNNAVKYSDEGTPITLSVQLGDGRVSLCFKDAGIGLTADQAERIFEPFVQTDSAIARARGGLGIGLTLVRKLVELHQGEISVTSEGLDRGSEFLIELPLVAGSALTPSQSDVDSDRAEQKEATEAASIARDPAHQTVDAGSAREAHKSDVGLPTPGVPAGTATTRRLRILVVDDNRDAADTLAMMLEFLGHHVDHIYNPREALGMVTDQATELVFLDIGMPEMDGYEVARQIRANIEGRGPMLVAMTGWGQPEDRRKTAAAGFDHHLVKPPDIDAIGQLIEKAMTGSGRAAGVTATAAQSR